MANDSYTDDEYDDTYEEVHGDEPARDQYDEEDNDAFFGPAVGGWYPAGWGIWPTGDTVDADEEYADEAYEDEAYEEDEDDSWWDEGLIATLLVVGVGLFLFPEPATSAIGMALIATGVVAWLVDWAM